MKITIIGASAGVGLATLNQALAKGDFVTALSTQTESIPNHPNLTKVNGSATSISDLKKVMKDAEAVIVAIGTKNKKPNTLFSDTAKALVEAGKLLEYHAPILIITGFGAGKSGSYLSFFMRSIIRLFLKYQYENKTIMEEIIAESDLNWEIVRPGMLTNRPPTQNYLVMQHLYKGMKIGKISRADVADFLLKQAEQPTLLKQYPALSS